MIYKFCSILQRAGTSKDSTEIDQEKENITLAYNSLIVDKKAENSCIVTDDNFDKAIKNYDLGTSATSDGLQIISVNPVTKFCIPLYVKSEGINIWRLFAIKENGTYEHDNYIGGIRPVFTLSPNVKIISGKGTEAVPFEIGL